MIVQDFCCLNNIPLAFPEKEIHARLGKSVKNSSLEPAQAAFFDRTAREAFSLCSKIVCWGRVDFKLTEESVLLDELSIESRSLAEFLKGSHALLLMAATVGNPVMERRDELMQAGRGAESLIYDAVAGETVDACLDWLVRYLKQRLSRRAEFVTKRRFSPGYGDLNLKYQQLFFDLLKLREQGMILTDRFFMIPEKSVTAFAGILKNEDLEE